MKALDYQVGKNKDGSESNHYKQYKIQPITFIMENKVPFCEANVIKYIMRWRFKNQKEDLLKAKQYIEFLLEGLEDE